MPDPSRNERSAEGDANSAALSLVARLVAETKNDGETVILVEFSPST